MTDVEHGNGGVAAVETLLRDLTNPEAYDHPVRAIEVIQTHASVVFLVGDDVYKIKKPVDLGFLDYSTAAKRRDACVAEVELNRRLAPEIYLAVVPVTRTRGRLRIGGRGPIVEHAVHMRRLPADRTLAALLERGEVDEAAVRGVARRLARFHAEADAGPAIARFGTLAVVGRNCHENFEQLAPLLDDHDESILLERLRELTEAELEGHGGLIDARASSGVPRDTHGDLRLDHVYLLRGRDDDDPVIIDCIEFNERFRYEDPVADIAFLVMDLRAHGAWDLAEVLTDAYFAATNDVAGRSLLPLYTAYRATVRAKVDVMTAREPEVPAGVQDAAAVRSRAHLRLAFAELVLPADRPCMVLVAGLPGTGKSVLASGLAERAGFVHVRSDVVRKQLAGLRPQQSGRSTVGTGLYTSEWSDRTYDECLSRARDVLARAGRVVVDANFRTARRRASFVVEARRWGVRALMFVCELAPAVVRRRLAERTGDASDADWAVYEHLAGEWERGSAGIPQIPIDTGGTVQDSLKQALQGLSAANLC